MIRSGLWYKVRHPMFDPDWAYQAVDYILNGDTSWAHLVFVLPAGHTWATLVFRCTCLPTTCEQKQIDPRLLFREQTETERLFPWAKKPDVVNPDLDVDLY